VSLVSLPLDGTAFEGVAERFRLALEVVGVELRDNEACLLDQSGDPTGEKTPTGQSLVQWFEPALPALDRRIRGVLMLDEVKGTAGP
jgi:hypothetical protein